MLQDGIPISAFLKLPPIFTITHKGAVYQGQEQHFSGSADPDDREALWTSNYDTSAPLYQLTKQINAIRSLSIAKSSDYTTWQTQVVYSDAHNVAFRKGTSSYMILMVLNNLGDKAENYSVTMPNVTFPAGLTVVDVLSCKNVTVDTSGSFTAQFVGGLPMVSCLDFLALMMVVLTHN